MPAWYDIRSLDKGSGREEDGEGTRRSMLAIGEIVDSEVNDGIPVSRIVLGGFSQGGALALYTATQGPHSFSGVIALSAYLPLASKLSAKNSATPIFMGHGTGDFVVQHSWGKESAEQLKRLGCSSVTFKSYQNLDHSCNDTEIRDVTDFLLNLLTDSDKHKDML